MIDLFDIQGQTKFYKDKTAELKKLNHEIRMEFDKEYRSKHFVGILNVYIEAIESIIKIKKAVDTIVSFKDAYFEGIENTIKNRSIVVSEKDIIDMNLLPNKLTS